MDFKRICSSEPFAFIVGPEKFRFYVNMDLFTNDSTVLVALMKGKLREAEQKEALLEDINEDSFARVIQFVLTGAYTSPDPHLLVDGDFEHALQDSPPRELGKGKGSRSASPSTTSLYAKLLELQPPELELEPEPISELVQMRRPALETFNSLVYQDPSELDLCGLDLNNTSDAQDFTAIFLCHASLYLFAEKYDIQRLKSYAAHRLHQTLAQFTLFMACVPDIVSLVRYTYEHTLQAPDEPLRAMMSNFCAWNINQLSHSDEFIAYYEEGGRFTTDVLINLIRRTTVD